MNKKYGLFIGFAVVLMTVFFIFTGCDTGGGGGDDEIVRPAIFDGYYGVTTTGETIEIIISTPVSANIIQLNRFPRSVNWSVSSTYEIKINGVVVSRGTCTNNNGKIGFSPTDGSAIDVTGYTGMVPMVTVIKDGVTYSSSTLKEAVDFFYGIGASTYMTESQMRTNFSGKTPEQIYQWCISHTSYFPDYPEQRTGTFDDIVAFGNEYSCPIAQINRVTNEINSGSISGWGFYVHPQYGNIIYGISRIPFN
jgi:hypothetical protein